MGYFSGAAYNRPQIHKLPSHSSKTFLSIVENGPPKRTRISQDPQRSLESHHGTDARLPFGSGTSSM